MSKNNPFAAALDKAAPKGPVESSDPIETKPEEQPQQSLPEPDPVEQSPSESPVETAPTEQQEVEASSEGGGSAWWDFENKSKEAKTEDFDPVKIKDQYNQLVDDPDVSLLLEFKKAGKGLQDLIKEYQEVDYDSMDYEKLAAEVGKLKGYSDEEIEEMVDDLKGLGRFARDKEIDAMKSYLNQTKSQKRKNIVGSLQNDIQKQQYIQQKAAADLQMYKTQMIGNEFAGLKFGVKEAENFEDFVKTFNQHVVSGDGTVAMGKMFRFYIGDQLFEKAQAVAASNGYAKGKQDLLKEISRPVKQPVSSSVPINSQNQNETKHDPMSLVRSMRQAPSSKQ